MSHFIKFKNAGFAAETPKGATEIKLAAALKAAISKVSESGEPLSITVEGKEIALEKTAEGFTADLTEVTLSFEEARPAFELAGKDARVLARLPGQILSVAVKEGQKVQKGELLAVLDAMKMENDVVAHKSGVVSKISVKPKDIVKKSQLLMRID